MSEPTGGVLPGPYIPTIHCKLCGEGLIPFNNEAPLPQRTQCGLCKAEVLLLVQWTGLHRKILVWLPDSTASDA